MAPDINLTIDGKSITAPAGSTILQAAEQLGEAIPTICYHEACTSNGLCRLCVVEVEGSRLLQAACIAPVSPGMVVHTRSERVERTRRTILELLNSSVDLSESARIQAYLHEYTVDPNSFPGTIQRKLPLLDDNPMFIRDYTQCVLCWLCLQVCAKDAQYTFALTFQGRGFETQISTFYNQPLPETTCVFCGQCLGVCPTGALKPKREWLLEQGVSPQETMVITGSKE